MGSGPAHPTFAFSAIGVLLRFLLCGVLLGMELGAAGGGPFFGEIQAGELTEPFDSRTPTTAARAGMANAYPQIGVVGALLRNRPEPPRSRRARAITRFFCVFVFLLAMILVRERAGQFPPDHFSPFWLDKRPDL
jgi:hypothetical protein